MRKTDVFWREKTRAIITQNPRMGDKAVFRELERIAKAEKRNDYPAERTIRRIREEFQKLPEGERRQYQLFSWPGAMGGEDLPWEASPVALELLRHYHQNRLGRPLFRVVKWYWRVTQASPIMAMLERLDIARALAVGEVLGGVPQGEAESLEGALAGAGKHEPQGVLMPADRDTFMEVMAAMAPLPGGLESASAVWESFKEG